MIRVLVNGAKGKMGQELIKAIQSASGLKLVAACDVQDSLSEQLKKSNAEVAVDFTHPNSAFENAKTILEAGVSPVIGTTGFQDSEIATLQKLAVKKKIGGLIAPNFSIGMMLLNRFAAEAAQYFNHVEIVELHHNQKADAPSGTALQSAKVIQAATKKKLNQAIVSSHESVKGVRGGKVGDIPVHSLRLPGMLAHQEIIFGGPGQILTLRHDAMSRETYMPGVLLAIRKVQSLDHLVYGLENLLF